MNDTLDGECILGDSGFQQPPEDTQEPIGDVCADADLPELEDVRPSGSDEVLKSKLEKGERRLQEEKTDLKRREEKTELKESEEKPKDSQNKLIEKGKEAKQERLQDESEAKQEEQESERESMGEQLKNESVAKQEELESGRDSMGEQLKNESVAKQEELESERESMGEQLKNESVAKQEELESGRDPMGEQLKNESEAKQEELESERESMGEQLKNESEAKQEELESGRESIGEQLKNESETKQEELESEKDEMEEQLVSKEQRRELFKEARALEEAGDLDEALEKFTAALTGVRPETAFPELPTCLRALAEIYYKREEYEKAVHFVQAEKMYYEAALLDTSLLQSILKKDVKRSLMEDKDDTQLQMLRANEYETLSRFCVDKAELPLALEYAAKAAKLRETVFGPDHEETIRSLDFMTSIYADLGKQEYAESLEKFERSKEGPNAKGPEEPPPTAPNASVGQSQDGESFDREVRISLFFFAVMVFIAFAVLTCVSAYAYCKLTVSPLCESTASILSEQLSWLHYQLHKWLL